jgi:4'-phosphopantetheinyl transferase
MAVQAGGGSAAVIVQQVRPGPEALPEGVEIRCFDLDDERALPLAQAISVLAPDELERGARFRRTSDETRYLRARALLRLTLAEATVTDAGALAFRTGAFGKPTLIAPEDGRSLPEFNLSHSGGLAVIALSWTGPVGVDVELDDRPLDPLQLAPSVLAPAETKALEGLEPKARQARFLGYWTAKEALLKFTGDGLSTDPRSIVLTLEEGQPTGFASHPHLRLTLPDLARQGRVCTLVTGGPVPSTPHRA